MYIKKIYEYKIHNIDIWSINQLCTQRFPWPLFSRVLWILQKRWWTWFLSTTSNRSIQDFTNFSNGQGILTVPRVTMDVNTWKVEHLICQKKQRKEKAWQLFLVDVNKMHITPCIIWSYCFEIATQSWEIPCFSESSRVRPFFWSAGDWSKKNTPILSWIIIQQLVQLSPASSKFCKPFTL